MKRIFAWATDSAGCWMYRLYWPLTHLDKHKFEVKWGAPGPDIFDYDIVIGQRIAGENELWRKLCMDPNVFAVYDLDDDLLNVDPENEVPYSIYHSMATDTRVNIDMADAVTVSTPNLADMFNQSGVHVLPNCLPQSYMQYRQPPWPPVIGWGGSMFHRQDWGGIPGRIADGIARVPGPVSFHTVGADYIGSHFLHRYTGWSTVDSYLNSLDFSFGIAPLVPTKFNASKSHVKLLEYASKGIPAIAMNWGQYPDFIEHGTNGMLVNDPEQWTDWIAMLADDQEYVHEMGLAAYQTALRFTTERNIHLWESVYES